MKLFLKTPKPYIGADSPIVQPNPQSVSLFNVFIPQKKMNLKIVNKYIANLTTESRHSNVFKF